MQTLTEQITEAINSRLKEINKPKRQLAIETGITANGIQNICNGMATKTSTLDKIFKNLGLEIQIIKK